ncbi:MAG: sugar phosphate isomerase/epimerase [Candidatus Poribacteria bacterium]|nr:sugar phosphate isomerase/epimerase [Candidatus Poribacteria bacterium]
MKELGCSTILYGGFSLDEALAGIAKAGYKAIELCARPGMAPHLEIGGSASYYGEVKAKIASHGLAIESIAGTGGIAMNSPEFDKVIEAAQLLGAPAIAEGAGGQSDDEESFKQVVEQINEIAARTSQAGIKLSLKPHVGNAVYSTATALRFMQEVDHQWVGLNFDASHIWRTEAAEDPIESLKQLKNNVMTLRIRDNRESRERPIGPVETQIPGKGAMDLPALAAVMNTIDQVAYATLEIVGTHGGTNTSLDEVQRVVDASIAHLKPLFAA